MSAIPVTVLTGFLGAGKTSVLNALLAQMPGGKVGIVENEFGEIGIDNEIVAGVPEEYIRLSNGCICCTVRGDIVRILDEWATEGRDMDRVIIETTGLADPGPIVQTLRMEPRLRSVYAFQGVTTVVDCRNIGQQLIEAPEVARQIGYADLVVMNKADLVADIGPMEQAVIGVNPFSTRAVAVRGEVPAGAVFATGDPARGLDIPAHATIPGDAPAHSDVQSFSFSIPGNLSGPAFYRWVGDMMAVPGRQLYRMKGLVALAHHSRRILLQVVRDVATAEDEQEWGNRERISRVVVIGRGFDEDEVRTGLMECRY